MSLGYPASNVLDAAVTAAVDNGIHVVAAAANDARPVDKSPGRAEAVITVGSSNITDSMSWFSDFGPRVDIFAPGENILSALFSSNTGLVLKSGTSMASPHVAGLVAYLVGLEGNKSPAAVLARIKEWSPDGILTQIPADTHNELINNGANL